MGYIFYDLRSTGWSFAVDTTWFSGAFPSFNLRGHGTCTRDLLASEQGSLEERMISTKAPLSETMSDLGKIRRLLPTTLH